MAESAPPKIESVEWCRDCGGSGEDYAIPGGSVHTIACHACGGNGFVPYCPSGADGRGHNEGEGNEG